MSFMGFTFCWLAPNTAEVPNVEVGPPKILIIDKRTPCQGSPEREFIEVFIELFIDLIVYILHLVSENLNFIIQLGFNIEQPRTQN